MKGKLTPGPKIKKMNLIEVDGLDDSSGLSSISDNSQGEWLNGSDEEDKEDDEEYDVVQMTDKEARRMFDNEVLCSVLQFVFNLDICPSCPRLQTADHNAALLFDNDNHIKIATAKSDRSQ